MGLKEAGLRGSLRSVSTGVSAIPDSGVLYDEGSGEDFWIANEELGTGSLTKEDTYLEAVAGPDTTGDNVYSWQFSDSGSGFDATDFSTLEVEWEGIDPEGDRFFQVSTWLNTNSGVTLETGSDIGVEQTEFEAFSRKTTQFDVSEVNQEVFAYLGADDDSGDDSQTVVRGYRVQFIE